MKKIDTSFGNNKKVFSSAMPFWKWSVLGKSAVFQIFQLQIVQGINFVWNS